MRTITVNASTKYDVIIGSGLLSRLGTFAAEVHGCCKAAVISDSNVWPLYGKIASESLENAGFPVESFVFPAGEESKSGQTYLALLDFLAQRQLTRSDLIIALGGGVTGDLAGFAAATYLRGIPFIQVPTTLLAAVDSSVGGKTAIDLPSGKNLAGAFYQPALVLCDTDCLQTLPREVFLDGCAEVIKYGVLFDPALFAMLEQSGPDFCREDVIARCVELKRDVVAEDEFDRGTRQLLNLGHTIGHGVEAGSAFAVSHGKAVAIGMAIAARAAASFGICDHEDARKLIGLLEAFSLPTHTNIDVQQLYRCALSDKKRSGGSVNLIVPQKIGSCSIRKTPVEALKSFMEAGM